MSDQRLLDERVGWHPDPTGRYEYRWFNGRDWTGDVASGGQRLVDPLGVTPATPAARRGLAIAAFVIGLISLVGAALPIAFVGAAAGALLAIGLGIGAIGRARRSRRSGHPTGGTGRGLAIAGLLLGIVSLPTCVLGWYLTGVLIDRLDDYTDLGEYTVAVDQCDVGDYMALLRGTITNHDDHSHAYALDVRFSATVNGAPVEFGSATVTTASVDPGASASFSSAAFDLPADVQPGDVECRIATVEAASPFGFETGGGIGT